MKELKIFWCKHCGNLEVALRDSGVPLVCCGEKMQVLKPNTAEAATEKHLPAITEQDGNIIVQVGSVLHPMLEEHHIVLIALHTTNGMQVKWLTVGEPPVASFRLAPEEKILAAYEYCNLHGLWQTEV